jgi:DNA repair exonuclease SbcCD ATPase subunit
MKDEFIKLPIIKEIEVKGYDLFNSDWKYEFKNGLNLFVGGNRLGKTTTVYILLYGIVGIPQENKNFFSDRLVYREQIKDARPTVRINFDIGSNCIEIERNLLNSQINYLSVNRKIYKKGDAQILEEIYSKEIVSMASISSLDDYKFLLEKFLIREEEGNYLLWDPEAQIRVLRLLFNYEKFDEEFRKFEGDVRKFDTDVRGQQDIKAQFRKRLDAIKKQKSEKIESMEGFDLQGLEKQFEVLNKDRNALNFFYESILEKIKNMEGGKKQSTQIVHGLSNEIEELDSEIIRVENIFFKSVYSDPKIQLADHKLKYYQICMFCNKKIPKEKAQSIVGEIENKKRCPVCSSEFKREIEDQIDERGRTKLVDDLVKKRKVSQDKKRELSLRQKQLDDLSEKLKGLWTEKSNAEVELENQILAIDDIKLKLSRPLKEKRGKTAVYDRDIKTLQDQIDYYQKKIDDAKNRRTKALNNLKKKNSEFNQTLEKISNALVKVFKKYVNEFFDGCELVIKEQRPSGSKIDLNVFIPKFDGHERTFVSQVSKSEAIFLEYVFRMSLCELFKQITGNKSFLVIETSEGAFDIGNVRILAESISRFYSNDSYLLVISNLGRVDFLKDLVEKTKKDISDRVLNFLKIGRLSKEQERDGGKFDDILKELFKI